MNFYVSNSTKRAIATQHGVGCKDKHMVSKQDIKDVCDNISKNGEQYILNWIEDHQKDYADFKSEISKIEKGEDSTLINRLFQGIVIPQELKDALNSMSEDDDTTSIDKTITKELKGEYLLGFDFINNKVFRPQSDKIDNNGGTILLNRQFPDALLNRLFDSGLRRNLAILSLIGMDKDLVTSVGNIIRKAITLFLLYLPDMTAKVSEELRNSNFMQCAYYFVKFDGGFRRAYAFIMKMHTDLNKEGSEGAGLLALALPSLVGKFAQTSIAECFGDKEEWAKELDNIQDYETKKELVYAITQTEGRRGRRKRAKKHNLPKMLTEDVEETLTKIITFREKRPDCDISIMYEALIKSDKLDANISLDCFLKALAEYDTSHPFTMSGVTRKHKNLFHENIEGVKVIKPLYQKDIKYWTNYFS